MMGQTTRGTVHQFDPRFTASDRLRRTLIASRRSVLRLSDSHYLVRWRANSSVWCVIDMTSLDEHAMSCPTFRYRQCCEHLRLIGELCAREAHPPRPRQTAVWRQSALHSD
jgi:hypothetical protein